MKIIKPRFLFTILITVLGLLGGKTAWAHSTGENYSFIDIKEKSIEGHFEINVINLRKNLNLDIDPNHILADLKRTAPVVQEHILEHYAIYANGTKLPFHFTKVELFGERSQFAQYFFDIAVDPMPDKLDFENTLFLDKNPRHRGLLLVQYNHKTQKSYSAENAAMIFGPDNSYQTLDLNDIPQLLKRKDFIWQGILHIWIGYDHILFLVALLLTAVLRREKGKWFIEKKFSAVLINFVKIITLFTLAHSITLTLAALGIVKVNSQLVESMIALSIILVALNNLFPVFNDRKWLLILIFGLFHGLGFATVMAELPFRMVDLVYVMLFFNIGVELGQLAIVAVLLPVLFYLSRYKKIYLKGVLTGGSIIIGLIATAWFIDRAFLSNAM